MPIRFRCAYCNQLMGIARRKAGTVVRCPTCAGQVVVPDPAAAPAAAAGDPDGAGEGLFDKSDIDELFRDQPAGAAPPPPPPSPPHRAPRPAAVAYDVEPVALQEHRAGQVGLVLSPGKVTVLSVLVVLLLGLAFFAGLVIG